MIGPAEMWARVSSDLTLVAQYYLANPAILLSTTAIVLCFLVGIAVLLWVLDDIAVTISIPSIKVATTAGA